MRRNGRVFVRPSTPEERADWTPNPYADIENRLVRDGTFWMSGLGVESRPRTDQPYLGGRGKQVDGDHWDGTLAAWVENGREGDLQW